MVRQLCVKGVASGADFLVRLLAVRQHAAPWLPLSIVGNGVINGYGCYAPVVTSYPIIAVENVHPNQGLLGMCVLRMG